MKELKKHRGGMLPPTKVLSQFPHAISVNFEEEEPGN